MKRVRPVVLLIASTLLSPLTASAQLGTLNLVEEGRTISVDAGRLPVVTVINRIPEKVYTRTLLKETQPIPPIRLPSDFKPMLMPEGANPCAKAEQLFRNWLKTLRGASDEKQVAAAVAESATVREEIEESQPTVCAVTIGAQFERALRTTTMTLDLSGYVLAAGEQLTITISRADPAPAKTWTFVLLAPKAGQWLTTWGFTFGQDRDQRYYLTPGDGGTFTVTAEEKHGKGDLRLIPSVFFHWLPRKDENANWSVSPLTAGLGISKDAPAVMVGMSLTRRQNVSIIGGGMLARAMRLDGVYKNRQVLTENLTTDKLHDTTYRAGLFISLAIRFDRNPFGGGEPATPEEGKKAPAAAEK